MRKKNKIRKPKFVDEKVLGSEPALDPDYLKKRSLSEALNWYNYFYASSDNACKKWLVDYLKNNKYPNNIIKLYEDKIVFFNTTIYAIARMLNEGHVLPDNEISWFKSKIENEVNLSMVPKKEIKQTTFSDNILVLETDRIFDEFYNNRYTYNKPDVYNYIINSNIKPGDVRVVLVYYTALREEITTFSEGYNHLTNSLKKNYVKLIDDIIQDCNLFLNNNKKIIKRKPRVAKPKPKEQLVKGLKYKTRDDQLNLVSINPTDIISSSILWVYNAKNRKLTKYVGENITLKGSTLLNFDSAKSETKNVRKPEMMKNFVQGNKSFMNNMFKEIKSKTSIPTGRINKDTLLIKSFK